MSQVATTILQQLGGNRFVAMTGAKDFVGSDDALMFRIPQANGINKVRIILGADDLYMVEFWKIGGSRAPRQIDVKHRIYADQLQAVFTSVTGLDTHL